jgi:hypothetical protein
MPGAYLAVSAAWLGDIDMAITYLESAYNDHDPILFTLKNAPDVPDTLRQDGRFQSLINRMNYPE